MSTPTCRTCGAPFKPSRTGATVNCPSHRTREARAAHAHPCLRCMGSGAIRVLTPRGPSRAPCPSCRGLAAAPGPEHPTGVARGRPPSPKVGTNGNGEGACAPAPRQGTVPPAAPKSPLPPEGGAAEEPR